MHRSLYGMKISIYDMYTYTAYNSKVLYIVDKNNII